MHLKLDRVCRLMTLAGVFCLSCLSPVFSSAQAANPAAASIPELPFKLVDGFLHYPAYFDLARTVGVAVGPKGQIIALNRGSHPLLEFDRNGKFVRSAGEGSKLFEGAHVVRFDPQGDVWVVFAADNVIYRFDSEGRTVGVLGINDEPWTFLTHVFEGAVKGKTNFYQETDIGWTKDGHMFVADGYGNSRVAEFDKDGNFVKQWGERGSQPGNFNIPHSLVVGNDDVIYVADRQNNRIQSFDTGGNLKQVWTIPGPAWSICLTSGPNQALFVGSIGKIYKIDISNGKIVGQFGRFGRFPGTLDMIHQLACPDEKTLYVVNEFSSRIDKWTAP